MKIVLDIAELPHNVSSLQNVGAAFHRILSSLGVSSTLSIESSEEDDEEEEADDEEKPDDLGPADW